MYANSERATQRLAFARETSLHSEILKERSVFFFGFVSYHESLLLSEGYDLIAERA